MILISLSVSLSLSLSLSLPLPLLLLFNFLGLLRRRDHLAILDSVNLSSAAAAAVSSVGVSSGISGPSSSLTRERVPSNFIFNWPVLKKMLK